MSSDRPPAVMLERACKFYGRPNKPDYKSVLNHLNMTVDSGIIYGLLGPSGCGKTTLLSCLVGRRQLDSGDIWVLGGRPGERGSGVPGPRVGYMPQEIALVGEFTVRDAIFYFGRIYGMRTKKMHEKFEQLSSLLELSDGGKLVKNLSGGQQRRVSLGAALVHEPDLLILDEPTVGLDPVLREKIWEFLTGVTRLGKTVIITTHYIDETKQAHKIGLLRDGHLLTEESPEQILRRMECNNLEDAFLKLASRQDEMKKRTNDRMQTPDVVPESSMVGGGSRFASREDFSVVTSSTDVLTEKDKPKKSDKNLSNGRYKAVLIKNIQQFGRHPGGLIFSALFPIITAVAFFAAVGHDPRDIHLAVVNDEAASSPWGLDACRNNSYTSAHNSGDRCEFAMISCWFLEEMERTGVYQKPYNSSEEAQATVTRAEMYGAMYVPSNFSDAMEIRIREGYAEDDVIDDSSISVWIDGTNHQLSHFLKKQLLKAYESFTKRLMRACGRPEDLIQEVVSFRIISLQFVIIFMFSDIIIPVRFHEPVYGSFDAQFVGFMAPGIMITIIFFLSANTTSTLLIADRLEGVWERSAVAGVKSHEMLHVHIIIQGAVIVFQTIEMLILGFAGYGLPVRGSLVTAAVLLFLQGMSGMCYGFLLSIYCSSYTLTYFVVSGSFYPMILLCGILWPLEGMYKGLKYFAMTLPFTLPTESLRDIMEKGSSLSDPAVYHGYLVTIAWIVVCLALCYLRLKYKKM